MGQEGGEQVVAGVSGPLVRLIQTGPRHFYGLYSNLHTILLPHAPGQGVTLKGNGTGLLQLKLEAVDLSSFQIDAGTPGGTVALPLGLRGHATGRLGARSLATPGLWKDQLCPGAPRQALSRQLGADVTQGPECSRRERGRGRGWLLAVPAPELCGSPGPAQLPALAWHMQWPGLGKDP